MPNFRVRSATPRGALRRITEMSDLRVMSFNIRVPSARDGNNGMENRRERVLAVLRRESPDLIGFQEVTGWVWDWLETALGDEYCLLGCGREAGRTGEGTPIAFRKDRFRLLGMECFWLSDTPQVAGSRYAQSDQSDCPRMAVRLLLRERKSDGLLTVINTHTDHRGQTARLLELRQLADALRAGEGGRLLLGDLNAVPDSREIRGFLEQTSDLGMRDVSADSGVTFHGYGKWEESRKIDYVFTNLASDGCRALAEKPQDGLFYSDHFALTANLRLP